jgi:hypothetical protein
MDYLIKHHPMKTYGLRGLLAYPNGLLDPHIETFGRIPWPGDQPDASDNFIEHNIEHVTNSLWSVVSAMWGR